MQSRVKKEAILSDIDEWYLMNLVRLKKESDSILKNRKTIELTGFLRTSCKSCNDTFSEKKGFRRSTYEPLLCETCEKYANIVKSK